MIDWNVKKVRLGDLKNYEYNPRTISKKQFEDLVKSIKEDGYHQRIVVNMDNTIIAGHARRNALFKAGYNLNDEIEVLYPSRELTEREFKRINIKDNLDIWGTFDMDALGNWFDTDDLISWGMDDTPWNPLKQEEKEEKNKKTKTCPHCGEIL